MYAAQVACQLLAERRWIMTGTPTPNSASGSSGVAHLQPLLAFLHHDVFRSRCGRMG